MMKVSHCHFRALLVSSHVHVTRATLRAPRSAERLSGGVGWQKSQNYGGQLSQWRPISESPMGRGLRGPDRQTGISLKLFRYPRTEKRFATRVDKRQWIGVALQRVACSTADSERDELVAAADSVLFPGRTRVALVSHFQCHSFWVRRPAHLLQEAYAYITFAQHNRCLPLLARSTMASLTSLPVAPSSTAPSASSVPSLAVPAPDSPTLACVTQLEIPRGTL
jgi:hypothetical protein